MNPGIYLAERGFLPDGLVRRGIRRLLRQRLQRSDRLPEEQWAAEQAALVARLAAGPIAVAQDAANRQHYEVPAAFFEQVMGPHRKYSCCWFAQDDDDLATAEAAMLALSCERARLADGQDILELGCGWGALTLWMARQYPHARIRALSNSASQRAYIQARAAAEGLDNISVDTADLATYCPPGRYDRVVSLECLEHMRNHAALFRRIADWLQPGGLVFIHVFCHRRSTYLFEVDHDDDWMTRHFFSGGIMPGFNHFRRFDDALQVIADWRIDGRHYQRTARAWRRNLARHRAAALAALGSGEDAAAARLRYHRWYVFFLACEECFGYRHGGEWQVGHYLLAPVATDDAKR